MSSLQSNFLRLSIYGLKTDEDDPSFLSSLQTATHHNTLNPCVKHQKPKKYLFVNYKYTSPYTMTHLYTIDHSRITGYLQNYDPMKKFFCLISYNNTSRPIIVPQENMINFDNFLLPCNVPTINAKPLTVIKHLVSAPLNDKEKSYNTALSKQAHSYNELLFISAKVITFMVKAEKAKSEKQNTTPDQYTPKQPTTTTDKLNNVLISRTLRDLTYKLDPYKKNPSDSPLTTLTHLLECYDHTLKTLQSWTLTHNELLNHQKQYKQHLKFRTLFFSNPI